MRRRTLAHLGLAGLAACLGVALSWWALARREYNEELVARLAQCRTLPALERILGWGKRDPAVADPGFTAYYWHLASRDSRVEWAVQAVVNPQGEVTQITYIPRRREPSLPDRLRRWLG